jgi:hypothetical protein
MKRSLFTLAILLAAAPAAAESTWYLGGGTTGVGGGGAFTVAPAVDIRAEYTGGRLSRNDRYEGNDFKTKLTLSNPGVIADWYVAGRFHLSAGLYVSSNKIRSEGRPSSTGTYTINGTTYNAANATVVADTKLRSGLAPYLGVGFATRPTEGRGFGFRVALGVMYQSPKTTLTVSGIAGPTLAQDVAAEERKINDKLNKYKLYPVANAYVAYTF